MPRETTTRGLLPWYQGGDKPEGHLQQKDLAETLADSAVLFDRGLLSERPAAAPALRGSIYDATDDGLAWCTGIEWVPVAGAGHIPVGGVLDWPSAATPPGPAVWLECVGQAVTRVAYPELFGAWGLAPEVTVVTVPDRRGRSPMGAGQGPSLTNRVVGQLIGGESVTLTTSHMPAHSHTASMTAAGSHIHNYGYGGWDGVEFFWLSDAPGSTVGLNIPINPGTHTGNSTLQPNHSHAITVNSAGSGSPTSIDRVHPSTITRYFVRAK